MNNKKYQIFISSTYEDLKEEREAAIKTILCLNHIPIGMEMFNAGDDEQWTVIKRTIDTSDYYVVIIGFRYGSINEAGTSFTELEYDYAISKGLPVLTFIKNENAPSTPIQRDTDSDAQQRLSKFREKAKKKMAKFWSSKDEFTTMLSTSLHLYFIQNPRNGWIPANRYLANEQDDKILANQFTDWIPPTKHVYWRGMNLYQQYDNFQFAADPSAILSMYVNTEKNNDGSFAFNDGQEWLLVMETIFGEYPLFPRDYVQLGSVSCSLFNGWNDITNQYDITHIIVTVTQSASYQVYKCVFDEGEKAFRRTKLYDSQNINLFF